MDLLIDIGNSRLKWATRHNGKWHFGEPIAHKGDFQSCVEPLWGDLSRPNRIVLACVASSDARQAIIDRAKTLWQKKVRILSTSDQARGIRSDYSKGELGVDRWLAVIGARNLQQGDVAVVDCGSAVNIEFLGANNQYLGGMILPGLALMYQSLSDGTATKLGELVGFDGQLGQSTDTAIAAGVICAITGAIEKAIQVAQEQHKRAWHVIITGGDASMLVPHLSIDYLLESNLVLVGMSEVLNWQG
ncbi:MAG: type III pantothenate kinase [Proteobacteria bacterium]|jgi:type III pantothenate kinase|nr:type III pantothenate kinase [Pseudomonadota bacterium]